MIITISGLTGSGKNTLGEAIAQELNLRVVCPTFKDLAKKEGISLMEFQKKAMKDKNIDKKFDTMLKDQAKHGNCVVTTWLGAWMVKSDLRIYVFSPLELRAMRVAKRDGISVTQAKKHIIARDNNNRKRYMKVYGIDIDGMDTFDVCLNNSKFTKQQLLDIALEIIKIKGLR